MALDKSALETAIKNLINSTLSKEDPADRAQTIDEYAGDLADAIDTYVKTGTAGGDPVI